VISNQKKSLEKYNLDKKCYIFKENFDEVTTATGRLYPLNCGGKLVSKKHS
jgi:hypothetical protein